MVRVRERHIAEAIEKGAQETTGSQIGNLAGIETGTAIDEGVENIVDVGGNFVEGEPRKVAAEFTPAGEARIDLAFWAGRAEDGGFGRVIDLPPKSVQVIL